MGKQRVNREREVHSQRKGSRNVFVSVIMKYTWTGTGACQDRDEGYRCGFYTHWEWHVHHSRRSGRLELVKEKNDTCSSLHKCHICDRYSTRSAGSMAERLTTNQEVPGSTPGWIELSFLLRISNTEMLHLLFYSFFLHCILPGHTQFSYRNVFLSGKCMVPGYFVHC